VGIAIFLASLELPWVRSRSLGKQSALSVVDLSAARWIFVALLGTLIISTVVQFRGIHTDFIIATDAIVSALLTIVPFLAVTLIDVLSIWLYPSFLPSTLRRLIFGVTPQGGVWLAIFGSAIIVMTVLGRSEATFAFAEKGAKRLVKGDITALAAPLLIFGIPLAMEGRYQPWLKLNSRIGHWSMPGFAVPFLGILTLILLMAILIAGVSGILYPHGATGIFLVICGWLLTLVAAIFLVFASPKIHFSVPAVIRDHLRQWSTDVHAVSKNKVTFPAVPGHLYAQLSSGTGLILTYAAGAMIAVAGVLISRASMKEVP
jgi:hypothetical protein